MEYWRKIYEKLTRWELYKKQGCLHMFIHCLLKAAAEDGEVQMIKGKNGTPIRMEVMRGQYFTSVATLSKETGMSVQTVRRTLSNIATNKAITHQSTKQGTLITISNFDIYQNKQIGNRTQSNKPSNKPSNEESNKHLFDRDLRDNKEKNIRKENNNDNDGAQLKAISTRARGRKQAHASAENLARHWNWAIKEYSVAERPVMLQQIDYMTPERESRLNDIVKAFTTEDLQQGVKNVMMSDYCNGRAKGREGMIADFDWVFQSVTHFTRIVEGRYRNSVSL